MRIEPKDKSDQAPSAILELVDGEKDMRFAMVAKTIVRAAQENTQMTPQAVLNIQKVIKFRKNGEDELDALVRRMATLESKSRQAAKGPEGGKKEET